MSNALFGLGVLALPAACDSQGDEGQSTQPSAAVVETVATIVSPLATASQPRLPLVSSGGSIDPGTPALMTVETHCGVRYLGNLNGADWIASDPASSATDWIPDAWPQKGDTSIPLRVQVVLAQDRASLEASFNAYTVTYLPTDDLADEVTLCE